jgi:hypothetical protein
MNRADGVRAGAWSTIQNPAIQNLAMPVIAL